MKSDLYHRHNTKFQNTYLKFLTPLTPFVENILYLLHGFKEVHKPRNVNVCILSIKILNN